MRNQKKQIQGAIALELQNLQDQITSTEDEVRVLKNNQSTIIITLTPRLSGLDMVFIKFGLRNFFWCQICFPVNFDFKNGCKINFRIITKNNAADSKIGSPLQIDLRADWTHESIPTAWELKL